MSHALFFLAGRKVAQGLYLLRKLDRSVVLLIVETCTRACFGDICVCDSSNTFLSDVEMEALCPKCLDEMVGRSRRGLWSCAAVFHWPIMCHDWCVFHWEWEVNRLSKSLFVLAFLAWAFLCQIPLVFSCGRVQEGSCMSFATFLRKIHGWSGSEAQDTFPGVRHGCKFLDSSSRGYAKMIFSRCHSIFFLTLLCQNLGSSNESGIDGWCLASLSTQTVEYIMLECYWFQNS